MTQTYWPEVTISKMLCNCVWCQRECFFCMHATCSIRFVLSLIAISATFYQHTTYHITILACVQGKVPLVSAEQDAMVLLAEAQARYTDAEERLERVHRDQTVLEAKLRDLTSSQDAQTKELQSTQDQLVAVVNRTPRINVSCQTAAGESSVGLEKALLLSQEELQLAQSDLAAKKKQAVQLQQEVEILTSRANAAASDALGSTQLALTQQKELKCLSKLKQVRREL